MGQKKTIVVASAGAMFVFGAVGLSVWWFLNRPIVSLSHMGSGVDTEHIRSSRRIVKAKNIIGTTRRGERNRDPKIDYAGQVMDGVGIQHIPLSDFDYEKNYPIYTTLLDVVEGWNPDKPEPPTQFKETLAHFDYGNPDEMEIALALREAEVPFKVYNVPEFDEVSDKWTTDYLSKHFDEGHGHSSVEKSKNNHFMFWTQKRNFKGREDYTPPTSIVKMTFAKWLENAKAADRDKWPAEKEHFYFMYGTSRATRGTTFMSEDLEHFSSKKDNFFVFRPDLNKGIQCRFGMRGIIAESHYDGGRNMIAMIRGTKRYILNPPRGCPNLGIISDKAHPSFRHSVIDWSDVEQARAHNFDKVEAIDTIVREGEVLYVPSYWFHYPISLEYSIQCNSRSGSPENNVGGEEIDKCLGLKDYASRNKSNKRRPRKPKKQE